MTKLCQKIADLDPHCIFDDLFDDFVLFHFVTFILFWHVALDS